MATVLDFFRANVGHPNSIPFMDYIEWNTSVSPLLSVAPADTKTVMIRRITWTWNHSQAWKYNQNDASIVVTQSDAPPSGTINLYYEEDQDVDGSMNLSTYTNQALSTRGSMLYDPAIKLDGPSEILQIQLLNNVGSPDTNGFFKGHLWIALIGWALKTEDY